MSIFDRFKPRETVGLWWDAAPSAVLGLSPGDLYRTQPNLRAVVSFIADNVADLPLKVYRRESDTDRPRVTDSVTARLLKRPNADQTTYEFIRGLVSALALFDRAYVLIGEDRAAPSGYQLRLLPDAWIFETRGDGWSPTSIIVRTAASGSIEIGAEDFIAFHGYNPATPRGGLSPVESLRQTLSEQIESGRYRSQVWKRGGRVGMYITRPKDVAAWDEATARKWAEAFRSSFTGDGGSNSGGVPVLEDGMDIKTIQLNAKEAQWAESVQLGRSDVAAAYHINPALIWHDQAQTYASAKDNARQLYAEALGPWLTMIAQRMNAFLLPRIGADELEYVEFDIRRKLEGSFEERAAVIQSSVGAPWMTRNEARAMSNLPAIEGGDELIVPLNVIEGGLSSGAFAAPAPETKAGPSPDDPVIAEYDDGGLAEALLGGEPPALEMKSAPTEELELEFEEVYRAFFERQARSVLSKIPKKDATEPDWWDYERWTRELADDLEPLVHRETAEKAREVFRALGLDPNDYSVPLTVKYIRKLCQTRARKANQTMEQALIEELNSEEPDPKAVYAVRAPIISERSGRSIAAAALAFGLMEGINQGINAGASPRSITKTWRCGANPRATHAGMDGETVAYDERFSNGARWPQDVELPADESANCNCTVDVHVRRA